MSSFTQYVRRKTVSDIDTIKSSGAVALSDASLLGLKGHVICCSRQKACSSGGVGYSCGRQSLIA